MHYFFIETAQQFFYASEVARASNFGDYRIINLTFNKIDRDRIKQLIADNYDKVPVKDYGLSVRNLSSKKKFFTDLYKLLVLKLFYYVKLRAKDSIYVSVYKKPYFWQILNSSRLNVNLFDDGLRTLFKEDEFSDIIVSKYNPFRASFKYLPFLFPNKLLIKNYKFYTFFDVYGSNFIKLNFKTSKKNNGDHQYNNEVWFLGQPLIDMKRMDVKTFTNAIHNVKSIYPDLDLVYFPHPKELNYKSYFSGKSCKVNVPFEIFFNSRTILPKVIISFYSTSIILSKVFKKDANIEFIYLKFDNSENIMKTLLLAEERYGIKILTV